MKTRRRDEAGETLVEILIALIVMGLVVGAFFGAITTGTNASKSQHDYVAADAILRNYAEAAKQAVRTQCLNQPAGTAFTVSTPTNLTASGPNGLTCPAAGTVNEIDAFVTIPSGATPKLSFDVRTP